MRHKCFDILNLPQTASVTEVRQCWRDLAATHHPDKGGVLGDFLYYKTAYEQALKLAQDLPCPTCEGQGQVPGRKRGQLGVSWSVCPSCNGSKKAQK